MTLGSFSIQYRYFFREEVSSREIFSFYFSVIYYYMPNTSSAKKALKQSHTKASRNRRFNALYKETLKAFTKALEAGTDTTELLSKLFSRVDTLVKKNILHINNASRKKSRFAKMVKAVSTKA